MKYLSPKSMIKRYSDLFHKESVLIRSNMGICLDTEQKPLYVDVRPRENGEAFRDSKDYFRPQNTVIWVLGGPGSGKISHCEAYAHAKKGFFHLNMTQVLFNDFYGQFEAMDSKSVVKLLSSRLKTHGNHKGYLISGFPRNTNDLEEYLSKVGRVDGVIFLNWQDSTLEKQIKYGASLGEIDPNLAKLELKTFRNHAIPLAESLDQKKLLYVIKGERTPNVVYEDFVFVANKICEKANDLTRALRSEKKRIIYVSGGPGSSKGKRTEDVMAKHYPSWYTIGAGSLLWRYLKEHDDNNDDDDDEEKEKIQKCMQRGHFVPSEIITNLILTEIDSHPDAEGYVIAGFPRDIHQTELFEKRLRVKPPVLLIDCSEFELGRNLGERFGRIDDNPESYKMRMELYRNSTLPLLKYFDEQGRLHIIDGDVSEDTVRRNIQRSLETTINSSSSTE